LSSTKLSRRWRSSLTGISPISLCGVCDYLGATTGTHSSNT
jgi:hypothetical protein